MALNSESKKGLQIHITTRWRNYSPNEIGVPWKVHLKSGRKEVAEMMSSDRIYDCRLENGHWHQMIGRDLTDRARPDGATSLKNKFKSAGKREVLFDK